MGIVGTVFAVVVAFFAWTYGPTAVGRALNSETRLGYFEERVANIPSEFERRSKLYRAVWEEFKECMQKYVCDSAPILAKRDKVIALEWPGVYDRLVVFNDWGTARDSLHARDSFFRALEEKKDTLRERCVPKITFHQQPTGDFVRYFEGFVCPPQPRQWRG